MRSSKAGILFLAGALALSSASAGAEKTGKKPAYRIAVGLIVLEAEAPKDGFGKSEYFVTLRRDDPAVEREIQAAKARERALKEEARRMAARERGADVEPGAEEMQARRQLAEVRERLKRLRRALSGKSPQVSVSGTRMHFADARLPVDVYEGDRVTVSLLEEDAFEHDLMGRKTFRIDRGLLDKGRIELNTGWAESIQLTLVPAE